MKNNDVTEVRKLLPQNPIKDIFFFALCVITAVLTIYEPIVLSNLIDQATAYFEAFQYHLILIAITTFLARIGLTYYKKSVILRYRNRCILALSNKMVDHLFCSKISTFEVWSPSYLVSRVIDEPTNIDGILPYCLLDGIISALICVIIFLLMLWQSWVIALVTLLFVVADYVIAFRLPLTTVFKAYSEKQAKLKSRTANLFQGITQIKMGDHYVEEGEQHCIATDDFLGVLYQKNFLSQVQRTASITCRQFGYLLIIIISAVLIAAGKIGLGQFTMLLSLYNLLWSHTGNAENLIPMYKYGQATCERIVEILSVEAEPEACESEIEGKITSVRFNDIHFAYHDVKPILKGLSFCAERGKITALAGGSGCGKSTALNLLLGFLKQNKGTITVNGKKLSAGQLVELRTKIGYVGQDGFLFNRSLRDNLLYYAEDTEENVELLMKYLRLFSLNQLVDGLPAGLDHVLADHSATLSGGEKQRLCIIRELMKKPDVLILDECTSHLDSALEGEIFEALKEMAKDVVILQVAHRATALAQSDIIYVLNDGVVAESGTHQELMGGSLIYQELLASMASVN